ncbi:MAG: prolipoprotein diacylglyceryl transferase, partial [Lachnospiraceae bacterium]
MFPYFEFLGKTIGSYAVCAIIGLFVCGITAVFLGRRYKIAVEDIILVMVSIGIGLLIGGHLLYGITNLDKLTALFRNASSYSPKEFMLGLGQCFGGMVYYGGFLGAAVGVFLHTKFSKAVDRAGIFDLFAVTIPLFHAFARVGCFLGGCCYGIESRWGFAAHNNTLVPEVNGVVRLPVQLLEAACNLVIFAVLLFLFREGIGKGKLIWYYLLFYPVVRFVLEFFRGDAARGFLWGLSTSQWISILLFACAVIRLGSGRRKGRAVCAGALLGLLIAAGAGMGSRIAFAAEEAPQEVTAEQGQTGTQNESTVPEEGAAESADRTETPGEQ